MRNICYLIIFFLAAPLFSACSKNDIEHENSFDKSYRAWQVFKKDAGNSYRYTVVFGSWVGFSTETVITVTEGKVTGRSYVLREYERNNSNVIVVKDQWTETAATLNTHEKGALSRTLDEVYQEARTNWLKKRSKTSTYFETKNSGMISSCGYVESNCADDCFVGISISSIVKL